MEKFVIKDFQPNFSRAQAGDIIKNDRKHPVNIKEWANSEKNGYYLQSIPASGERTINENNLPLQLHIGMGETWTP